MQHRRTLAWLLAPLLLLTAVACGDDGDSASAAVASLADTEVADTDTDSTDAAGDLSAEDAVLAFSECLREEGIDVPDIGVDADGNIDLRSTFAELGFEPGSTDFQTAQETCFPLIEGVAFGGGGGRAGLADNPEIEDAFLEYSDCIRNEGFDVGDLTLPGAGGGAGAGTGDGTPPEIDGEGPVRGEGQGQGGFGDPSARFGELLGLDTDDPEVAAALELCNPIIDEAFSATGIGPGGDE